jgi:nucleoside-diphosphate-sugar epimerase
MSERVLISGHDGYIGTVLVPMLVESGYDVVGLDSFLYAGCSLGPETEGPPALALDVREVQPEHLEGVDAVIHLAAISNDPLGDLHPETTYDINHGGTVALASAAKRAGVSRFLFSSSCSLYGAHGDDLLDESAEFLPVTPYGESKVLSETTLRSLADDDFSPTFLRNATVYGASPRLRGDLVVNNLTGFAVTTGEVFLKSDGTPWRPLVHVQDVALAFVEILKAPRDLVHDEAFNVCSSSENYRIRDVAEIVERSVPDSRIVLADTAGPDLRNYRVSGDKLCETIPTAAPRWTVEEGVNELVRSFTKYELTLDQLEGDRFMRLRQVNRLIESGRLNSDLRWKESGDGQSQ